MKNNIFGKVLKGWSLLRKLPKQVASQTASRFAAAAVVIIAAVSVYMGCDQGLGVSPGLPALTGTVTINGDLEVGQTLMAETSDLPEAAELLEKQYQWQRSNSNGDEAEWEDITEADTASGEYDLTAGDIGKYIKVLVGVTGYKNALSGVTGDVVAENGVGGGGDNISFASEDYTVDVQPDMESWSDTNWTLNVLEAGTVYFAVNKAAEYTIEVGGADAAKVTQAESGTTVAEATEAGLTAGAELAVFTVDTRDLVFDGGTRSFTLGNVEVTLNVLPNTTGAAVFTVKWPEDSDYAYTSNPANYGNATLTRVWGAGSDEGALQAIEYVDRNAEANTEYLVRVEKDETALPRIFFTGKGEENVTIRLRGLGEPRILAFSDGYSTSNHDSYNKDLIGAINPPNNSSNKDYGFINVGDPKKTLTNKTTFILDNNITVQGSGDSKCDVYSDLIQVNYNATLVLRKGALITDGNSNYTISISADTSNTARSPKKHGKLRIEGGSITNCISTSDNPRLIYVQRKQDWLDYGTFYMAPSTDNNLIVFTNNTNNILKFNTTSGTNTFDLSNYLVSGLIEPVQDN